MDFFAVIFEGRYEFVFIYGNSSGNTNKRGVGLDVTEMNMDWGGGVMINMIIKDKIYLSPCHDLENPRMVKVGEEHTLVYESEADFQYGPFNITPRKI